MDLVSRLIRSANFQDFYDGFADSSFRGGDNTRGDNAGDPYAASCRGSAGNGPDRRRTLAKAWVSGRPFSDRGRSRRVIRFPLTDRPPVEHPCHGPGGIPLRGLLETRATALSYCCRDRRSRDSAVLAAGLSVGINRLLSC